MHHRRTTSRHHHRTIAALQIVVTIVLQEKIFFTKLTESKITKLKKNDHNEGKEK